MERHPSRAVSAATTLEPRVSAVVVVRNIRNSAPGHSPLDLCLRSALAEPWIDDLVVVDHGNAPEVSSALRAMHADRRDVQLIAADPEISGAAAANLGAEHARGRWLLFLDPDVVLQRGAVARMAAAGGGANTPWIVGGRLTDTEGRDRRAVRGGALNAFSAIAVAMDLPGPKPKLKSRRKAETAALEAAAKQIENVGFMPAADDDGAKSDEAAPAQVAAVSGAFMLIPRSDFQHLGGFDAGFYAGDAADLDLCQRAAAAGGSVLFQPTASGVQFERGRRRGRRHAQGLALFAKKNAKTPIEKAFAIVARPALVVLLALKDFVAGRPPVRR